MEPNEIVKRMFDEAEEAIDAVQKALSSKGEYIVLVDITDAYSKTVINKWDGMKIISQIEI